MAITEESGRKKVAITKRQPLQRGQPPPSQLNQICTGLPSRRSWVQIVPGPTLRVLKQWSRMCCLCCDICKRLEFLVFLDKDKKPQAPSHNSFTVLILVGHKRTCTVVHKEQRAQTPMVWYNLLWAGWVMKGLISINWNGSPVSSPVTISSHCGEFNKESMYGLINYLSTGTKKRRLWRDYHQQKCDYNNIITAFCAITLSIAIRHLYYYIFVLYITYLHISLSRIKDGFFLLFTVKHFGFVSHVIFTFHKL